MVSRHLQINLKGEGGSVTAELAVALPAVSLVLAVTLGAFALQIERMKLVDISATAARAFARGESEDTIRTLVFEMSPEPSSNQDSRELQIEFVMRENMSCVSLSRSFELPVLAGQAFEIAETQCARKMGL